jgi:hypothetical protein
VSERRDSLSKRGEQYHRGMFLKPVFAFGPVDLPSCYDFAVFSIALLLSVPLLLFSLCSSSLLLLCVALCCSLSVYVAAVVLCRLRVSFF